MKHHHHHERGQEDAAFWDRMWSARAARRTEPHEALAAAARELEPGAALDLGCGEGTDALWLAGRGWRVTGVDLSGAALARARAADAANAVTWLRADVTTWAPPIDAFDLVVSQFVHLPPGDRTSFFRRVESAVCVGGTFLFVVHAPPDARTTVERGASPDAFFTPDEVWEALSPGRWTFVARETRPREQRTPDGGRHVDLDTFVRARRIA